VALPNGPGTHRKPAVLEGETLRGKLEAGPIHQKQAVDYALQIAKGLSAAHEKGIVHRECTRGQA
jgi:serine/threonine protein kinase